jgi:hypothetical protein
VCVLAAPRHLEPIRTGRSDNERRVGGVEQQRENESILRRHSPLRHRRCEAVEVLLDLRPPLCEVLEPGTGNSAPALIEADEPQHL